MDEKKGTPATRAKNKYREKVYDRFDVLPPKGDKEKIDKAAEKAGKTRNAYVLEAIKEKMERDKLGSQ